MPHINYINQDYDSFLEMFYQLISEEFSNWSRYNENNLGNAYGKFLSMIGDIEVFYQNKMINQLMLPTTTLRKYAILSCKMLGYKMHSAIPSKIEQVQIEISEKDQPFTIPAGYPVGTKSINSSGEYIPFETNTDLIYQPGETTKIVSATSGTTIPMELIGTSNGKPNQEFILELRKAIDDFYVIYINENNVYKTWIETKSFIGQGSKDIFMTKVDELDRTFIIFGDGINGRIPPVNCDAYCTYRVGGGYNTNLSAGTVTENKGNISDILSIVNLTVAKDGLDRETIEEAKQNAPIFFKSTERAVTKSDFKTQCLKVKDVKRANAISIGSIVDVFIATNDITSIPTEAKKTEVYNYLNERKIITSIIIINEANFPKIDITLTGKVKPEFRQDIARDIIETMLIGLLSISTKDFQEGERIGIIYKNLISIEELDSVVITKFASIPIPYAKTQTANPLHTFGEISIGPAVINGKWRVIMTGETDFGLDYYNTLTDEWDRKSTGTIDSLFSYTINGVLSLSFTITSNGGVSTINDYWEFFTSDYCSDINNIQFNEIMKPGEFNITLTGGIE